MMRRPPNDPSTATHTPDGVTALIARCLGDDPLAAAHEIHGRGLWEYVAAEACDAGVGGVLLDRLRQLDITMPTSATRQMEAYHQHLAAANAYREANAGVALLHLQAAGVPFLLLKGAALNRTIYDQPGLRPMVDVDVLIRPENVDRADRALRAGGCTPGADLVQDDFYPRYYYEREYFTPRLPSVKIDLHCRPFRLLRYARTVPDNALWQDCRQIEFAGLGVSIPNPTNMLIHLAVHAACHGCAEMRWFYDIKLWLERFADQIDLQQLADKCRRWRLALPVNRALKKTRDAFGPASEPLTRVIHATAQFAGPLDRLALRTAPLGRHAPTLYALTDILCAPGVRFRLGCLKAVLVPGDKHLGQLYRRRHRGWQIVAHLVRLARCLTRVWTPAPQPAIHA